MDGPYFTYILASKRRGALFVGTTPDLIPCVLEHKGNMICGVTSQYAIHQLVYFERFEKAGPAMLREAEIKQLHRCLKLNLVETCNPDWDDLYEYLARDNSLPHRASA